jgi:signal transduction histidine kinase
MRVNESGSDRIAVTRYGHTAGLALNPATLIGRSLAYARLAADHYRWLLLMIPAYAVLSFGSDGWPLAAGLAAIVIVYNMTFSMAKRRWSAWSESRALYLRCVEIGLVCIGLSLLHLRGGDLESHFYHDGFYAIFVALAAVSTGRKGVFWSASLATLAVAVGQIMLAPEVPVILTWAGIEYWIGVILYSGTFGLLFMAVGLLAYLATDFQALRVYERGAPTNGNQASDMAVLSDHTDGRRLVEIVSHRERLAAVGEVTAQIAHGLSSPLTGIVTIVDYLLEIFGETEKDSLELVRNEAERAAGMVRELLHFSRRDANNPVISLNDTVQRALRLCALGNQYNGIEVTAELSPEPTSVHGGPSLMEQVVLNLLENARHAIGQRNGGRITVRTRAEGERIALEVSDNGPGIPPEVQRRIFEPFFTTKDPDVGTGLGLAIVQNIVRECDGTVSVGSRPGAGTTFTLSFPKLA